MVYWLFFLLFLAPSCTSKEEKAHKQNLRGEYLFRLRDEHFFSIPPPLPQQCPTYSWEDKFVAGLPRITKEFFRCKGDPLNPVITQVREGKEPMRYYDCQGKHGLPLREGKEFVYPCLLELLNYIQQKTAKRVVITCGHRCPKHNAYADQGASNWGSKHMIGAEVDFYVEGMESEPTTIVEHIQRYYKETFPNESPYTAFQRFEKGNLSTLPWYNKEIFIKLYLPHEGRDADNQHTHPYLSLQVRSDRQTNAKVLFDPKQTQNYLRH